MLDIYRKKLKTVANYSLQIQHFQKKDEEIKQEQPSFNNLS